MIRGPLSEPDFKGQFSGHETFPLRHLWLRKAYDAVANNPDLGRKIFTDPDAISRFGVGKNMVASIRHWATACDIIFEENETFSTTSLGDFLFGPDGADPYLEQAATIWLLHWMLAGRPASTTTWYWGFNHYSLPSIDVEQLTKQIVDFVEKSDRIRTSAATLKRDAQCFIRSYANRADGRKVTDDSMEPVLAELGLLRSISGSTYQFQRGPKPSLPDGVLNFALADFWNRFAPTQSTLSVEAISFEPGSPGRVFRLDDVSLVDRLSNIGETSGGAFIWSDTAGLRNVSRRSAETTQGLDLLKLAYPAACSSRVEA